MSKTITYWKHNHHSLKGFIFERVKDPLYPNQYTLISIKKTLNKDFFRLPYSHPADPKACHMTKIFKSYKDLKDFGFSRVCTRAYSELERKSEWVEVPSKDSRIKALCMHLDIVLASCEGNVQTKKSIGKLLRRWKSQEVF